MGGSHPGCRLSTSLCRSRTNSGQGQRRDREHIVREKSWTCAPAYCQSADGLRGRLDRPGHGRRAMPCHRFCQYPTSSRAFSARWKLCSEGWGCQLDLGGGCFFLPVDRVDVDSFPLHGGKGSIVSFLHIFSCAPPDLGLSCHFAERSFERTWPEMTGRDKLWCRPVKQFPQPGNLPIYTYLPEFLSRRSRLLLYC